MHIWKVSLPLPEETVARLNKSLNAEERERSGQFRFAQDQSRFISARGALRTILALYLDVRPHAVTFGYGDHGKPFLTHPGETCGISFNLSHCKEMAIIGVASRRRIGVDVETIREFPELEDIAEQHFSKEECMSIRSAHGEARISLFYQIWTRREAVAKARGLDLSKALSDRQIPFYPPGSKIVLEQEEECAWSLHDLQLGPTCRGAVCVEDTPCDAVFRDFDSLPRVTDR